jgi:hypothetical protein
MKIKITVHIYYQKYKWEDKGNYHVYSFQVDDTDECTYVGPQEIEIEVPDNYDPRPQQIAALEAEKKRVMAEYQKTVTEITERINKLQAIAA